MISRTRRRLKAADRARRGRRLAGATGGATLTASVRVERFLGQAAAGSRATP